MNIIPTKIPHVKTLAEIGREQWPTENWITEGYLNITLHKKGVHLTAINNQQVVGSIMLVEEDYPKYWIHYLVVEKKYRRQGIGTLLLRKAEEKLSRGTLLFVDLEKRDTIGLKFYQKNGFLKMGKVKNWFEEKTGIILAKKV